MRSLGLLDLPAPPPTEFIPLEGAVADIDDEDGPLNCGDTFSEVLPVRVERTDTRRCRGFDFASSTISKSGQ